MKLQKDSLIEDLIRWQKAFVSNMKALSYSNNTILLYSRVIEQFIEYSREYQDEMSMIDIKAIYITGFITYSEEIARLRGNKPLNGAYLSKSSKQSYLKIIRVFFTFISDNNDELFTFDRHFKGIKVVDSSKPEEKLIYLNEDEVNRLLSTINRKKRNTYNEYRDALLVKLMLFGGLRISEALNVKLSDFTLGESDELINIKIYAKGGKSQVGYIAKNIIEDELEYFQNYHNNQEQQIMVTKGGKLLHRANAYSIVNRIYRISRIQKKGLHLLRHTLAMRLTQKNVNTVVIKKILRHASINTTTIYSKATPSSVTEAMREIPT